MRRIPLVESRVVGAAAYGSSTPDFLPPRNSSVPRNSGDSKRQAHDHVDRVQLGGARRGGAARDFPERLRQLSVGRRAANPKQRARGLWRRGDRGMKITPLPEKRLPLALAPFVNNDAGPSPADSLPVGPLSARQKRPITQQEPCQRNNQLLQCDLRQTTACALGRNFAAYR
jgi:hypothetical protein